MDFEIGPSVRKTQLERHEEELELIMNHLDELPLDRFEDTESAVEDLEASHKTLQQDFAKLEIKVHNMHTHMANIQKRQTGHANELALNHVRIFVLEMQMENMQDY